MRLLTEKDELTRQLQQMIASQIPFATETDYAEANLCSLSWQSRTIPNRHAWLDIDADGVNVDLEDWTVEGEWDNAVARVSVETFAETLKLLEIWFSGEALQRHYHNISLNYEKLQPK